LIGVAPLEVNATLPLLLPAAVLPDSRTYTVVVPMDPEAPTVTEDVKVVLSIETSNPIGAVAVIPAAMFTPEIVKLVELEADG
jgi:predicted transcriptional regulator